jgi:hypothetical protein
MCFLCAGVSDSKPISAAGLTLDSQARPAPTAELNAMEKEALVQKQVEDNRYGGRGGGALVLFVAMCRSPSLPSSYLSLPFFTAASSLPLLTSAYRVMVG